MSAHLSNTFSVKRPAKSLVREIELRIAARIAEENDPYTRSLGKAAVLCVRQSRVAAEAELARALGDAQ